MKTSFGPWATAIDSQTHLGTFWKRRINMLPCLGVNDHQLNRRDLFWLALTGVLLLLVPLVRFQSPLAAEDAGAKPVEKGKLLVWKETRFVFLSPDGKELGEVPNVPQGQILNKPALSYVRFSHLS